MRLSRSLRKEQTDRINDLVAAWNDYPPQFRAVLMVEWPDLYYSVSRLVRWTEVTR